MCWHTANDAIDRQIDAAWWIILPYSGKIWMRHVKCLNFAQKSKQQKEVKYEKETYTIQMARHDASARGGNGDAAQGCGTG